MSVNDFEKQAQQKMDELKIRPSDTVWEEVEKRIRKKKKRRRIIVWFLLVGIMLMGGLGWWMVGRNNQPLTENKYSGNSDKNINELKPSNEESPTQQTKKTIENPEKAKSTEQFSNDQVTTKISIQEHKKISLQNNPHRINDKKQVAPKPQITETKKPEDQKIVTADRALIPDKSRLDSDPAANQMKTDIASPRDTATIDLSATQDIKDNPLPTADSKTVAVNDDSVAMNNNLPEIVTEKKTAGNKKNKWEWGLTGEGGLAYLSSGIGILNIFDAQKSADAFSTPGTGTAPPPPPTDPTKGFSWATGIYGKRQLTSRIGISAGLEFTSLSTRQSTGILVDSSRVIFSNLFSSVVADFYRTGNRSTYTNHYNYLQLPVLLHWQINKNVNSPLVWRNGLSIGMLTGSDALVYSESANLYYHDNRLLNKVRLTWQSGISVRFFGKSNHPFNAGLNLNVPLSQLQKINSGDRNRLASVGLQFGWIMKK